MNRDVSVYIIHTFGIVCIMSILLSFNVYAKDSFNKKKVDGVMSTGVGSTVVVTWESLNGASGYEVYEWVEDVKAQGSKQIIDGDGLENIGDVKMESTVTSEPSSEPVCVKRTTKCKVILKDRIPGCEYHYYVVAYRSDKNGSRIYSRISDKVYTTVPEYGKSTIKNFLRTAIAPMGNTMYVWGGGWNKADTAAGKEAKSTGLAASWRSFAKNKKAGYNYRNYRYRIHDGLDCSGYVGWCIYNVMNTENGKKGYVHSASKQAKKFADMGFGEYIDTDKVKDYKPGDIMSSTCTCCGHVWIVVGQCDDGSVVIAHASPPGVQLSGTVTPSGAKNSDACKLARKYMKKYYPAWYKRYPEVSKGSTYLSHYGQMRWDTDGDTCILSDPDGYADMSAEEVLKDLFGE